MLSIGVTGGMGSGKSTVCRIFEILGVPVFYADLVAKNLQNDDPAIKKALIDIFGKDSYSKDGKLDRKALSNLIFSNKEYLNQVNSLIHPAVQQEFNRWKVVHSSSAYALYEAAIIFESNSQINFDSIVLVIADQEERIQRIRQRDNISREEILLRMQNQLSDSIKIKSADYVIDNNSQQMIIPQILKIDQLIKERSHVW